MPGSHFRCVNGAWHPRGKGVREIGFRCAPLNPMLLSKVAEGATFSIDRDEAKVGGRPARHDDVMGSNNAKDGTPIEVGTAGDLRLRPRPLDRHELVT